MPLPRFPCPACGRRISVTPRGLMYRHDPPARTRELKSCGGSLKVAYPPASQSVLFAYEPPTPGDRELVEPGEPVDQGGLF